MPHAHAKPHAHPHPPSGRHDGTTNGRTGHGHGHDPHDHDHIHHHAHHHGHTASATLVTALALTLGFAALEAIAGIVTGSLALLGDAGHMLSDSLSLGIAALAARLAARPPTVRHTYGLSRAEPLAALANGVLMLALIIWLVVEAADRITTPRHIDALPAAAVAGIGLVVNLLAAWLLMRGERTLNVRAALLHVVADMLGSVSALIGLLIVHATGWTAADPLLTLLIGGLILASTVGLLRETLDHLLDGVPRRLSVDAIGRRIAQTPGVSSVHDLHVWSIGQGRTALSAHVLIDDPQAWASILVAIRFRITHDFGIEHVTIQPELPATDRIPVEAIRRPPSR